MPRQNCVTCSRRVKSIAGEQHFLITELDRDVQKTGTLPREQPHGTVEHECVDSEKSPQRLRQASELPQRRHGRKDNESTTRGELKSMLQLPQLAIPMKGCAEPQSVVDPECNNDDVGELAAWISSKGCVRVASGGSDTSLCSPMDCAHGLAECRSELSSQCVLLSLYSDANSSRLSDDEQSKSRGARSAAAPTRYSFRDRQPRYAPSQDECLQSDCDCHARERRNCSQHCMCAADDETRRRISSH